jgi:hypothetical protein
MGLRVRLRLEVNTPPYSPEVQKPESRKEEPPNPPPDAEVAETVGGDLDNFDPVKNLFDDGVRILGATGVAEKTARSLIGRWRASTKNDDIVALAIATAEAQRISAPLEWIPKFLANRQGQAPPGKPRTSGPRPYLEVVAEELAREAAAKDRSANGKG